MLMHSQITLGEMNNVCPYCQALKFAKDHFKCCQNGKVQLDPLNPYSEEFKDLLTGNTPAAKHLQKDIRIYNDAFAFASFSANIRLPAGHVFAFVDNFTIE